jgi:hypothetical protein
MIDRLRMPQSAIDAMAKAAPTDVVRRLSETTIDGQR